jgi:hypothetical protein
MYQVAQICYLVHSWPGDQLLGAITLGDRGRLPFIHQAAERNCPKSHGEPRIEASEGYETARRSPIWLLWGAKTKAPEATLDPFQTVSRRCILGNWASDSE